MHMTKTGSDKNCDLNSNVIDIDFNWNRVVVDMRKRSSTCSRVKKIGTNFSYELYSHDVWFYDVNIFFANMELNFVMVSMIEKSNMRISKSYTPYDIDAIITETYNLVTAANLIIIKTNQV